MSDELLKVRNLRVQFGAFPAVQDVTFDLRQGETLGLVGESGSGKSTLARAILRLIPVTSGHVIFNGEDLLACAPSELRRRRRDLQIVFQDPLASLNPRMSVGDALAEPLKIYEPSLSPRTRGARIAEMLERVGLAADMARRYPHQFSGGQCQRIGIARAMMLRPKLLVCDEPVSSLDVSIQGQIVNLLVDLQREFGLAMLFISHNLAVVRHLSHRVLVIYRGRLVEVADRDALFAAPAHPYTRALLAAVPDPTGPPRARAVPGALGDDPVAAPWGAAGCAFHDRCSYAKDSCLLAVPPLEEVASRHFAACHRWREVVYSSGHETR
ncbi:MAG: oligopeptide transport system ATP-binding protein [Gammaproteobacteria bacterium]|nr:oligopeptide transport system ATP-binding protein [Gammaproteobacteria bacterium]